MFAHVLLTGHIQTSDLDGEKEYEPNIDTCVTLDVPADHSVLVTFSFIELENDCDYDYLELSPARGCRGSNTTSKVCFNTDLGPTLYDVGVLSVLFHSDHSYQRAGFRLLFSFLHVSQRPLQLATGQWDCEGPGASVLLQHMVCTRRSYNLCADGKDRVADTCPSGLCGPSFVSLGGRCYQQLFIFHTMRWRKGEDASLKVCKGPKSHLASLNTQQEWTSLVGWMTGDPRPSVKPYMMVGLRLTNYNLPAL